MRPTVPLCLALLLVAATLAPTGQARELPGDYPAAVAALIDDILSSAEEDAWPSGQSVHPNATAHLERARQALDAGRVAAAMEAYVQFRTTNGAEHVLDDLRALGPEAGRNHLSNVTSRLAASAQGATAPSRAIVNQVNVSEVTIRGAEAAVYGAFVLARGEFHLNLLPRATTVDAYQDREPVPTHVYQRIGFSLGAQDRIALGASIASVAPQVPGPAVEAAELTERLDAIASQSLPSSKNNPVLNFLPRGNPDTDGPILRAGLLLIAAEQLRIEDFNRVYDRAVNRPDLGEQLNDHMATDRRDLRPWASKGSALALAAFETVDVDVPPGRLSRVELNQALENRSKARVIIEAEGFLAPEDATLNESPAPPVAGLLVAVALASLVTHWRRR